MLSYLLSSWLRTSFLIALTGAEVNKQTQLSYQLLPSPTWHCLLHIILCYSSVCFLLLVDATRLLLQTYSDPKGDLKIGFSFLSSKQYHANGSVWEKYNCGILLNKTKLSYMLYYRMIGVYHHEKGLAPSKKISFSTSFTHWQTRLQVFIANACKYV